MKPELKGDFDCARGFSLLVAAKKAYYFIDNYPEFHTAECRFLLKELDKAIDQAQGQGVRS